MQNSGYFLVMIFVLAVVGCDKKPISPATSADGKGADDAEADIRESLAKLSDADRKLAQEQKYCAVMNEKRLGEMGTPLKVMVKEQPVFLCCKGCQRKALADPDKTLTTVESLKSKAASEKRK